jgi:4-coumarate--CoA ligase
MLERINNISPLSLVQLLCQCTVNYLAMPQKSRWSVSIPEVDIPTYLFGSPTAPLGDALAFADAEDPEKLYMTWTELRLWSQRFAAGLKAAGLREGDRVIILSGNDVLFPVINLGVIMASGIYQSANPHFNARELAYQLDLTTPRFMLASEVTLACALEAAKMVGMERERVFVFNDAPLIKDGGGDDNSKAGVKHWKHLLAPKDVGRRFVWKKLTPDESKSTTVYTVMTSGFVTEGFLHVSENTNCMIGRTTGLPKAAEASHYGILANCVQTDFVMSLDPNLRTKELAAKNSRWLCTIPLYHGLAMCYFCTISIARRVPSYIMRQYEINRMLDNIQRFRITELHLVPPIIVAMTKHPALKNGKYDINSVTKTFSCAAPLGPGPTLQYESLWPKGHINVKQGLASTEFVLSLSLNTTWHGLE